MLLSQALTRLLHIWDIDKLDAIPDALLRERIPMVLIQILNQTLFARAERAGWATKGFPETTAYEILTLKSVATLPWNSSLHDVVTSAIYSAEFMLSQSKRDWTSPARVWIEKVIYGCDTLSEAYCLAAMRSLHESPSVWGSKVNNLLSISEDAVSKLVKMCSGLQNFRDEPLWRLKASAVEGLAFLPQLYSARADVLPRQKGAENKYLTFVPFTWVLINNLRGLDLGAGLLWDMMVLTVCNFRVDEYMETIVSKSSATDLEEMASMIRQFCVIEQYEGIEPRGRPPVPQFGSHNGTNGHSGHVDSCTDASQPRVKRLKPNGIDDIAAKANEKYAVSPNISFRAIMGQYIRAMLTYPGLIHASTNDYAHFRSLIQAFLLSHLEQISDNSRFTSQTSWTPSTLGIFEKARTSFYTWVHSTGADSISCPFSFAFLTCLTSASSRDLNRKLIGLASDCFGSVRQKYLAQELSSHLATMSRLYNDYGSLERDRLEANINSINFPEFHVRPCSFSADTDGHVEALTEIQLKRDLLELAELERRYADDALDRLLKEMDNNRGGISRKEVTRKAKAVKLFAGVAKLYADIYVTRDLSNRV